MYAISKTICPSTGLDLAVSCTLNGTNLVTVSGNILSVWSLDPVGLEAKLSLLKSFELCGIVTSMGVVHLETDCLLLAFGDAKMSLVQYVDNTLVTLSLHSYEKEKEKFVRDEFDPTAYLNHVKSGKIHKTADKPPPKIRVDPESRCALLWHYGEKLAILPFKTESAVPTAPSFCLWFTELDPLIRNVIDCQFLLGFFEPTLAILYENTQTAAGRVGGLKDTVSLIVLSLDIHQRKYPVLYRINGLPFNSTHIIGVPPPVGGILIFSHNAVIHTDQSQAPGRACIINKYFDLEVDLKAIWPEDMEPNMIPPPLVRPRSVYADKSRHTDYTTLGLSLDGCRAVVLNPDSVLLVLRSGQTFQLDLIGDENAGRGWGRRKAGVVKFDLKDLGFCMAPPVDLVMVTSEGGFASRNVLTDGSDSSRGGIVQSDGSSYWFGYFFVASRAADGLLVQFRYEEEKKTVEAIVENGLVEDDDELDSLYGDTEPAVVSIQSATKIIPMELDDDLDMELYGEQTNIQPELNEGTGPRKWVFTVQDRVLVAGPARDFAVGVPVPSNPTFPFVSDRKNDAAQLEFVSCGGEHPFASLVVQSESIRPHVFSSFDLPGITDLWTCSTLDSMDRKPFDQFILLSQSNKTLVLKTGKELEELAQSAQSGFYTEGPTIACGRLDQDSESFIIQVYSTGFIVLGGDGQRILTKSMPRDTKTVSASICESYILLLLDSGSLKLFTFDSQSQSVVSAGTLDDLSVTACSLYTDFSDGVTSLTTNSETIRSKKPVVPTNGKSDAVIEEEDDLYAQEEDMVVDSKPSNLIAQDSITETNVSHMGAEETLSPSKRFWCFFVDERGDFYIVQIPGFKQVLSFPQVTRSPSIIQDGTVASSHQEEESSQRDKWAELLVVRLGDSEESKVPYMFARSAAHELLVYKLVSYSQTHSSDSPSPDRLSTRFTRLMVHGYPNESESEVLDHKRHLVPFEHVGSPQGGFYSGVFLSGSRPCMVVCSTEGPAQTPDFAIYDEEVASKHTTPARRISGTNHLWVHPLSVDGTIHSFAPFHNDNIQFGFVYANHAGSLRLCTLPSHFNFDNPVAVCKVHLPRTPEKISYHYNSETYVVATSAKVPFVVYKAQYAAAVAAGVIQEGEPLPETELAISGIGPSVPVEPGMYLPEMNAFKVELVSPVTWETVDTIDLQVYEQVVSLETVELESSETASGRKLFVAIGTAFFRGEDLGCRGRLILYEIIDVVPEIDNPQTNHKFKLVTVMEDRSPITALCAVNGYLLAALGSKVIMYELSDKELTGIAFMDVNIFTVSLRAVKNLIIVSDICKSVLFVVFQEIPPKMTLLGKDLYPLHATAAEFLIDESSLAVAVTDRERNIHVLTYAPYHMQSDSGSRLVRNGEMHLGQQITSLRRFRLKKTGHGHTDSLNTTGGLVGDPDASSQPLSERFGAVGSLENGGMALIMPVSEKMYKRLYALYSRMVSQLAPTAGLNPRGFRQLQMRLKPLDLTGSYTGPVGPKGILDGDLLFQYGGLSTSQQRDLAKAIGTTDTRLLSDLQQIYSDFDYF